MPESDSSVLHGLYASGDGRQELMQTGPGMICDAREHIGEPCFGVDTVEACRHDERVHDGGSLGAVGACKQPGASAESEAARQRSGNDR